MKLLLTCCFAVSVPLFGCSGGSESGAARRQSPAEMPAAMQSLDLPSLFDADQRLVESYAFEMTAIAAPGANIDANGLIGDNRRHGRMISPRFQLGSGAAVRVGLHQPNLIMVQSGFRAVEAGLAAVAENGEVVSTLPPNAPRGTVLRPGDRASGAAFFLADACTGLLALAASDRASDVADLSRRTAAHAAVRRATGWLASHRSDLMSIDRRAPNRLLYDALAFHSCGALVGDGAAQVIASEFVAEALAQIRPDGVFVEQGGSDTTYQAVSVRLSLDLLLAGYAGPDRAQLNLAWQNGANWLGSRIMADGRIDSTGNTRTCSGGESFLGREKKVWPPSVFAALAYAGQLADDADLAAAAVRLSAWAGANPRTDPCFP